MKQRMNVSVTWSKTVDSRQDIQNFWSIASRVQVQIEAFIVGVDLVSIG